MIPLDCSFRLDASPSLGGRVASLLWVFGSSGTHVSEGEERGQLDPAPPRLTIESIDSIKPIRPGVCATVPGVCATVPGVCATVPGVCATV